MKQSKKSSRTSSARAHAAGSSRSADGSGQSKREATTAASRDRAARQFFDQVAQDKQASVAFLKAAGILNDRGNLAKPFKG